MAGQQRIAHPPQREREEEGELPAPKPDGEKLKRDIDAILDEIDEVLEESVDLAANYVQKGGQ